MRVLATVLAYARRISFDIARIGRGAVEWRREQQGEARVPPDKYALDGIHRYYSAVLRSRARENRPRLRDRIYLAFLVRRGAQRLTVVKESAAIPFSIPRLSLQRGSQRVGVGAPSRDSDRFLARLRERNESCQRRVEKPTEPNTFTGTVLTDPVHPVVPVAGSHKGKSMRAEGQRGVKRNGAMLEKGRSLIGDCGIEEDVMLARLERLPFKEGKAFIKDREISGDVDVVCDRKGEPRTVVRDTGAHALTGVR